MTAQNEKASLMSLEHAFSTCSKHGLKTAVLLPLFGKTTGAGGEAVKKGHRSSRHVSVQCAVGLLHEFDL
jgi:hypothetical protein